MKKLREPLRSQRRCIEKNRYAEMGSYPPKFAAYPRFTLKTAVDAEGFAANQGTKGT